MLSTIDEAVDALRRAVAALDGVPLSAADASRVVGSLSQAERICQAGRAMACAAAVRTRAWRAEGYRTPAAWLAAKSQAPLGQAIKGVATAHRLGELPATRAAFLDGRLSESQAGMITQAAAADPCSESSLLDAAGRQSVNQLRERCRAVTAAAVGDEDAAERIRRGRYLRHWVDPDGAIRLNGRFAPDDGAGLTAAVDIAAAKKQDEASRSGQHEPAAAYAADALCARVAGVAGARPVVNLLVDASAFQRGHTVAGETCRIQGGAAVPVAVARRMAARGQVKVLGISGADITSVAHAGRMIPARVRTAVQRRDPVCVVPGCEVRTNLEIDHVVALADGGITQLANLARLCRWHHAQKTHHGWVLSGGPGQWRWAKARAP